MHKGGSAKCTLYAHKGGGGVKKGRKLAHVLCTQSLNWNFSKRLCLRQKLWHHILRDATIRKQLRQYDLLYSIVDVRHDYRHTFIWLTIFKGYFSNKQKYLSHKGYGMKW